MILGVVYPFDLYIRLIEYQEIDKKTLKIWYYPSIYERCFL